MKKHKSSTTKVEAIHQKTLIAIARLKGDEVKSGHGYKGTWGLRDGDENIVIEGWTHQSLPQSNGKLDNLKMEYAFKKEKLLLYQWRSKKNQA